MSEYPDHARLIFLLPDILAFAVPAGRHSPCLHGCVLTVDRSGLVTIDGPSRERVFAQAARFLRLIAKGHGPLTIAAVLTSLSAPRGRDSWSIIVGADVAFAPTSITPTLFAHSARDPPAPPQPAGGPIGELGV